ncbi:preprotein translocase subunit YajC [Pseudoclavibacter chungangensis]|nr:preprotein translocase subunit YajC [Pseudoclavibacter chungangensis]NYJ66524.1 preprotein translocase subunit YajC [Pseudoclavibacter chungangensis]
MDLTLLLPLALLALMLVFMWRSNKKRQAQAQETKSKAVVGAEVMTQAGIYGTIVDIDADNNVTTIETTPGTRIRVHSATVLNVVTPNVPDDASELIGDDHIDDERHEAEAAEETRGQDADTDADDAASSDIAVDLGKHEDADTNEPTDTDDDADSEHTASENPLGKYTDPDAKA